MLKRAFVPIAVLSSAFAAVAAAQSIAPDSTPTIAPAKPDLFLHVIANQKRGEAALDLYERIERVESRKTPGDPAPATIKISRVIPSGTGMFRIPVGDDVKPSDSSAYRADLENLARALALLVNDSGSQREALEKYTKKRKDRLDLIEATRNAFLFTFLAHEPRGERMLSKYSMRPNPAFKPTTRFSSVYTKVRGFVWIDDISIGLFLGKVYKGSHFMQERYEYQPGLWLASFSQYDFDGRKLFSGFSLHERAFYSNYRYIGPPKEALAAIRQELEHAELDKLRVDPADP